MSDVILSVKNLTTKLAVGGGVFTVVDEITFDLFKGKTLAIVGESGSGKSMTALSLLRILPSPPALPSEGEVLYRDKNLLSIPDRQMQKIRGRGIAMIFQDPMTALNPVYPIGYQIEEVLGLHLGIYGEEAEARVIEALKDVGIPEPERRMLEYPHQMSGGMKQRVMIAMALLCEPDILIADEPTTALDVTVQAQVLELMQDLQKRKGMAIMLITHDMGVVAAMADDVLVMYAGQAIEKAGVHSLFDEMAHPYTKGLFNSRPHMNNLGGTLEAIPGMVPSLTNLPEGCRFHPRCKHCFSPCSSGNVPAFPVSETSPGHQVHCWLAKEGSQ